MDFDLDFPSEPAPLQDEQAGTPMPSPSESDQSARPMDFDLDFLSEPAPLRDEQASTPTPSPSESDQSSRSMDFDLDFLSEPAPLRDEQVRAPEPSPAELDQPMFDLDDSLPGLNFDKPPTFPAPEAAAEAPVDLNLSAPATDPEQRMSFDLSEINFDFDTPDSHAADDASLTEENPLDTKLSLAEEFRAIGDLEGARSLAEEVLAEASGTLKSKADSFLAELG
jgi:pilus assembly protein FimV